MAFHSPMPSSSAHHPYSSLLHPARHPLHRFLPVRLCLRIPRIQLPPLRLPLALPSSNDGNTNNSGDGGGDGEGRGSDGDGGASDGNLRAALFVLALIGRNSGSGGASDGNRRAALFVLALLGRKLESLPSDLAAAVEGGRVTGDMVRRFVNMERSLLLSWLLQLRGFRERLLADELFLAKAAMECGVGVIANTAAEYEERKENFVKEIDAVIALVVMGIVADFSLVYFSAPIVSLQPSVGTIKAIISQTISGARPFVFMEKLGKIVRISPKLFAVGTSASQRISPKLFVVGTCACQPSNVDTGVTDALIKARKDEEFLVVLTAHKVGAELSDGGAELPCPGAIGRASAFSAFRLFGRSRKNEKS